jgi:hypothetical protein
MGVRAPSSKEANAVMSGLRGSLRSGVASTDGRASCSRASVSAIRKAAA